MSDKGRVTSGEGQSPTPETDAEFNFVRALKIARCRVEESPLYDKWMRHTPLENDVPVWMAQAYCEGGDFARRLQRERDEAIRQRDVVIAEGVKAADRGGRFRQIAEALAESVRATIDRCQGVAFASETRALAELEALIAGDAAAEAGRPPGEQAAHDVDCGYAVTGQAHNCSCGADDPPVRRDLGAITEARELVCSALGDLGGVCERLREIESGWPNMDVANWQDVENWVTQACETLGMITTIAARARGEGDE